MLIASMIRSLPVGFNCYSVILNGTAHQLTGLVYSPLRGGSATLQADLTAEECPQNNKEKAI